MSLFKAGIVAFAVCLVTGLPGDWGRRRALAPSKR